MKRTVYVVVVVILIALAFVIRLRTLDSGERPRSISEVQAEEGIPVDISRVTRGPLEWWRSFSGTVEGARQGAVAAEISQEITAILHQEGDTVRAGEPLIRLDPVSGIARFEQARANYDWSRQNLERMEGLFEEGAISRQALDDARRADDVARADFEAARTTVELEAPIDGVVTYMGATVGRKTVPGELLATVARIDEVRIILQVSEPDVRLLRRGQAVRVTNHPGDSPTLTGEVERVAISADPDSRLFEVELRVMNTGRLLFPGTLVPVSILVEKIEDCARVPLSAVMDGEQTEVVVVTEEGTAERRRIHLGMTNGRRAEVLAGLTAGEAVVVAGQTRLSGGEKVKIHAEIPSD